MIEAVLFDLDGTLLDSAPDLVATLNHLRSELDLVAMPVDELRHFVSQGAVGLIKAGMPPCDDETLGLWRDKFLQYYAENSFVYSRPFEGVGSLLSELGRMGMPWGIVTNKMEYLSIPILEQTGWLATAETVICGDSVNHSKPHPEPVLAACSNIGVKPRHTLMVGDDRRDVEAGQRAGTRTALALYGYASMECHLEVGADVALIKTPEAVLDLLEYQSAG